MAVDGGSLLRRHDGQHGDFGDVGAPSGLGKGMEGKVRFVQVRLGQVRLGQVRSG